MCIIDGEIFFAGSDIKFQLMRCDGSEWMHQHVLVEVVVINLRAVFALLAKRASGFSVETGG